MPAGGKTITVNRKARHDYFVLETSKKIGNAVKRNHARRLIRAAFLSIAPQLPTGKDYVFVAREDILTAKSYRVAAAMKKSIDRLLQPRQSAPSRPKSVSAGVKGGNCAGHEPNIQK